MNQESQRTWLDAFTPPDGLVGHTAAFVTMSADVEVLECVMERFTGCTFELRRRRARVQAYLLRDARNWNCSAHRGVLTAKDVPGLFELSPKRDSRLLHAKLAILSFAPGPDDEPTALRLVVGTGNYTTASAKQLLELVFTTETHLSGASDTQAFVDLVEAARFVRSLARIRYATAREPLSDMQNPMAPFVHLIEPLAARRPAGPRSRFFHSLDDSMWDQLAKSIKEQVPTRRNLLICGSGFYEQVRPESPEAEVLRELAGHTHLQKDALRYLVTQPDCSGQLRASFQGAESSNWGKALRAVDMQKRSRRLHAKFVLIGRWKEYPRKRLCVQDGFLYLGSANLTRRGFLLGPSKIVNKQGNIETGVFFHAGAMDEDALLHKLFVDRKEEVQDDEWGTIDPKSSAQDVGYINPCLLLYVAETIGNQLRLAWSTDAQGALTLQFADGETRIVTPEQTEISLRGPLKSPSIAVCSSDGQQQWIVPVIDPRGRFAYEPPRISSLEALLAFFEDKPDTREEEDAADATDSDVEQDPPEGTSPSRSGMTIARKYPLLEAATFLERIARVQERIEPPEINTWLARLEQLRDLTPDEDVLALLRGWNVDVFHHLEQDALAPSGMNVVQRERYRTLLHEMAQEWGLR